MKCPNCSKNMIWNGDQMWEDMGRYGEGVVSIYGCRDEKCDVDSVYVYTK
jgi:hypothetical protein